MILVLDSDMTPALAVVRSLARLGLHVDVASPTPDAIASYSRHCRAALIYPDPLTHEADFLAWVAGVLDRDAYRLIIPVTERTVVPLQSLQGKPGGERLTIAPPDALNVALDKDRTLALAARLGIPAPRSQQIDVLAELEQASQEVSMPVVLKPARSIGADGAERRQLSVAYAFTPGS
jgi:biotin carboxylase